MAMFRVPYPGDPEKRKALFEKAAAKLGRHGTYEGTPDGGTFQGTTPIGAVAGAYRSPAGADYLEIEIHKKPWVVPVALVENKVREFMAQV
ncbi:hypothetical protein TA3x_002266 [Tundrisphaera sp. TA3]|uniref:hypothetical protein n=1 Tax=Tundrisphaera sp. TA3 TaxID=3435775 RepID=UPI003EBD0017